MLVDGVLTADAGSCWLGYQSGMATTIISEYKRDPGTTFLDRLFRKGSQDSNPVIVVSQRCYDIKEEYLVPCVDFLLKIQVFLPILTKRFVTC